MKPVEWAYCILGLGDVKEKIGWTLIFLQIIILVPDLYLGA